MLEGVGGSTRAQRRATAVDQSLGHQLVRKSRLRLDRDLLNRDLVPGPSLAQGPGPDLGHRLLARRSQEDPHQPVREDLEGPDRQGRQSPENRDRVRGRRADQCDPNRVLGLVRPLRAALVHHHQNLALNRINHVVSRFPYSEVNTLLFVISTALYTH